MMSRVDAADLHRLADEVIKWDQEFMRILTASIEVFWDKEIDNDQINDFILTLLSKYRCECALTILHMLELRVKKSGMLTPSEIVKFMIDSMTTQEEVTRRRLELLMEGYGIVTER
jgi:hypothetical protein